MYSKIYAALLTVSLCAVSSLAQPVLTYTDLPTNPGITIHMASDPTLGAVDLGEDGPNQTWNFTGRAAGSNSDQNWVEPNSTPFISQFSTANRCAEVPGNVGEHTYTYFVLTSASITVLGSGSVSPDSNWTIPYTSTQPSYPFPITYGAQWNTVFRWNFQGSSYYDSTRSEVDAWGTLTDLMGSWPCLRVRMHITRTITIFGFPFTTTTWAYTWLVAGRGAQITIHSASNEPNQNFTQGYFSRITDVLAVQERPGPQALPASLELNPASPNPFNATTQLRFTLPQSGEVTLKVFNSLGREVSNLAQGYFQRGAYQATFDGASLPSGTYFARLAASGHEVTQSVILLK